MNKIRWKIAFAYIGVIVGAGLSSGQDLLQYFLCFGKIGLLGIALLGVLNAVFGRIMITLGCYYRADNHEEVFSQIAHPVVTRIIDVVLIVGSFVMGFVMIAGAGANLNQQFGLAPWLGALICSGLVVVVAFLDFDKITSVLGICTPVMIVMIALVTAHTFIGRSYDFDRLDAVARTIAPAMDNVWLSVVNYYSLCAITGVSMAFILGGALVRIGVAEKGGTLGGALIGVIVLVASLSLFANIEQVKSADMPMLAIVNGISPELGFVYAITVFGLIFNTAFSLFYSIARRFSGDSPRKNRLIMIGTVALGYLLSFGGFKKLIGVMYPVLGYMGCLMLLALAVGWFREREAIIVEKMLRRKMLRISLKKHHPRRKVSQEERTLFHNLSEISVAETETLKEDVHETAKMILENTEDLKAFVEKTLAVDEEKLPDEALNPSDGEGNDAQ